MTSAPIGILPSPLLSEKVPIEELKSIVRSGDAGRIAELFRAAFVELGQEMGFVALFQPQITQANPLQTKAIYSAGGERKQGGIDYEHMNGAYGELVLAEILSTPAFMSPGRG